MAPLRGAMDSLSASIQKLQTTATTASASLDALTSAISANVARFVELYNPAAVKRFELAVADLNAVIGRALMPVLERFTLVVREIGNAIAGLTPAGTKMIGILAAVGVGLGVAVVATGVVFSTVAGALVGLTVLAGAFGTATAIATAGLSLVFGAVAGAITALVTGGAAIGFVSSEFTALKQTVREFTQILATAFEAISVRFQGVLQILKPLGDALSELAQEQLGLLFDVIIAQIDILAVTLELMRPQLMLLVAAVKLTTDGIHAMANVIKNLFGITGGHAAGSSEGAAVRNVRFGSPEDAWREAMKAAFSLGNLAKPDPNERSAGYLEMIHGILNQWSMVVANGVPVRVISDAARGGVIGVGGIAAANVADRLRQLYDGG